MTKGIENPPSLEKRDLRILLQALGIAIEHTHRAIENCHESEQTSMLSKTLAREAIRERQRALSEFQGLRERLSQRFALGV